MLCQAGALKAGIDNLRRATLLAGDIPVLHLNLAEALGAVGHLDEASSHYARALELAPEFADAAAHLGSTLLRQNRVTEAVGVLRQAAALDRPSLRRMTIWARHCSR